MKHNFGYLIREGIRGIFVHGFMSFAAVCVTVACLIIMGSFSLILYNLNATIVRYEKENQVVVFVDENYPTAEAKSVGSSINMIVNVERAEFVSREEVLEG
ncbi:MAG: ABC transporter permease, partial [Eubacteriales bacterium]